MTAVERRLTKAIGESWHEGTEGFLIQVHEKGKRRADLAFGKTYDFYDWASLTKIVFTVTALMRLVDARKFALDRPVKEELDWFKSPVKDARPRELLTHSAGLTWWKPFYKSLDLKRSREDRWAQLEKLVAREMTSVARARLRFSGKSVYSDLDFFTLGALLRRKAETDFATLWGEIAESLDLEETRFHVDNKAPHPKGLYAPTERCQWRRRLIRGEVHDENTWALGGAAPHAGLFGPIDDLSRWGLALRRGVLDLAGMGLARPSTVRRFTRRALPPSVGDWGLGFTMPTKGAASCGRYFSPRSVGHLGFTGTSLWFDPKRDLLVTILSNRVYPTRENKAFPQLRPSLHNWVVESLGEN